MYKIDYYNSQNEIILTQIFKSIKELFEASYKLDMTKHPETLDEIGADSAVAFLDKTILLRMSRKDLMLEYNLEPFRTNDELYEILLSYKKEYTVRDWVRAPTKEELKNYLEEIQEESFTIGSSFTKLKTKHFTWDLNYEDSYPEIQALYYTLQSPDVVMYTDAQGEAKVAFKLEDFILANTGCSCKHFYILIVEYDNAN